MLPHTYGLIIAPPNASNADLYVSVEEFTSQLNVDKSQIITVKNYHKKSDLKETNLLEAINNLRK